MRDQMATDVKIQMNVMVSELALMKAGARENQDHQKMQIISMMSQKQAINAHLQQKTNIMKIETTFAMVKEPVLLQVGAKEHQDEKMIVVEKKTVFVVLKLKACRNK